MFQPEHNYVDDDDVTRDDMLRLLERATELAKGFFWYQSIDPDLAVCFRRKAVHYLQAFSLVCYGTEDPDFEMVNNVIRSALSADSNQSIAFQQWNQGVVV